MQQESNVRKIQGAAHAAPVLRSISDIIADLSKPLPERHLKSRVQGGKTLHYLEWSTAVRFLDHFAPGWSCEVRNVTLSDARCVVTMRIDYSLP